MPQLFLHSTRSDGTGVVDACGGAFADVSEAETEARASLREMAADAIRSGAAVVVTRIDIAEADGTVKASVDVADVIAGSLRQALAN